jgi:hypothetical protein
VAEPGHLHDLAPARAFGLATDFHLVDAEQRKAEVAEQRELRRTRVRGIYAHAAKAAGMLELHRVRAHQRLHLVVDVHAELDIVETLPPAECRQPRVLAADEGAPADLAQRVGDVGINHDVVHRGAPNRLQELAHIRMNLAEAFADARHRRKLDPRRRTRRIFEVVRHDRQAMDQQKLQEPERRVPSAGPQQVNADAVGDVARGLHRASVPIRRIHAIDSV